jgi:putative transposase
MIGRLSLLLVFRLRSVIIGLIGQAGQFGLGLVRTQTSLVAENLFLRKQLAFYRERNIKPHRLTDSARLALLLWSRWFDWRNALVVVKPETFIGWHQRAFQLFWRWKSRGGRPRLPKNLRILIAEMVRENPTWGEARIASELTLKLGIRVSPRTVRAYWPQDPSPQRGPSSQSWMTFVRNHARAIVACDFVVAVTLRFRILYVFVVMEVGSRRILHVNVTPHPTSSWTLQQLRESIPSEHGYRWLIHDRSGIFSEELCRDVNTFGIAVLKTPVRAPKANAYCERVIGSLRRECLDWFIPMNERHVLTLAREWAVHYNQGRPHRSLGPGIPDPGPGLPVAQQDHRHRVVEGFAIKKKSILGGLHHEYRLERIAA